MPPVLQAHSGMIVCARPNLGVISGVYLPWDQTAWSRVIVALMGLLASAVANVMRVMKAVMPLAVMGLAFAPVAHAEPKCFAGEVTVHGVSRDGRYALTSWTDHFGSPVEVNLLDLEDGGVLIAGREDEQEFKATDVAELLQVGRLTLRPMADGAVWRGSWSKLRERLQERCGPIELPTRVQLIRVRPRQVNTIAIGTKYAAVIFKLPETNGCSTTGKVVAGIPCGAQRDAEKADDRRILQSGTPTHVLATIAKELYRGRRDPLGAYRLVSQLQASLKPETTSPEVRLAIESDETLYLSQLGWIGRAQCRSLENQVEERLGDAWKSPPSPAAARMKQSMLFNMRKCHDEYHDP